MKTTRNFDEQVRPRRPYISMEWCEATLANPVRREIQPDGRIRHWGPVYLSGEDAPRYLRVVTLSDGETVHNAFLDRGFREGTQ
jgi:hypothetical protein